MSVNYASMGMWRDFLRRIPLIEFFLARSEGLDHSEGASTRFMFASGGILSEGYEHDGPGVGHIGEAEEVPSQGGRGDALFRRMPPYLT